MDVSQIQEHEIHLSSTDCGEASPEVFQTKSRADVDIFPLTRNRERSGVKGVLTSPQSLGKAALFWMTRFSFLPERGKQMVLTSSMELASRFEKVVKGCGREV